MSDPFSFSSFIDTIQDISSIKILNEDIRITLRKDIKFNVHDILLDGKKGESLTVPRWIGNLLKLQDIIENQEEETVKYISRSLNRERISKPHDLSILDSDFYVRIKHYLQDINENEKENLSVSLNSFVSSRLEKIVKLAAASPLYPELEEKLSLEEKEVYLLVNNISCNFKKKVLIFGRN